MTRLHAKVVVAVALAGAACHDQKHQTATTTTSEGATAMSASAEWDKVVQLTEQDTFIAQGPAKIHVRYDGTGTCVCTTCAQQPCADSGDRDAWMNGTQLLSGKAIDGDIPPGRWLTCSDAMTSSPGKLSYKLSH